MKTEHQKRIEEFMLKAGQEVPPVPTVPSCEVRVLRAKLILEECLETIRALGVSVYVDDFLSCEDEEDEEFDEEFELTKKALLRFVPDGRFDMVEVADGVADISVVATGTLSSCGIADSDILEEVDLSNLAKFSPGGYRSDGTDGNPSGKWVKPPDWKKPDIAMILEAQSISHISKELCEDRT